MLRNAPAVNGIGPNGRVYAFEPIPFTAGAFRNIARLLRFRGVELIEKGCGEKAGLIEFTVPVQESGAIIAGIVHMGARDDDRPGRERHARFQQTRKITCEVVALDEHLGALDGVSFVKCDIEGADYYAMKGARRLLERNKPVVVCEINPWFLEGFGLQVKQLVDFFADLGFQLHRYEGGRLRPKQLADVEEDNWIFLPPERTERMAALLG